MLRLGALFAGLGAGAGEERALAGEDRPFRAARELVRIDAQVARSDYFAK